eukprot:GSChrysophyteH1.ASY1.ANO1.1925.1 assembled CDS
MSSVPPSDISFDEFRNVRARDRAKQEREAKMASEGTGLRKRPGTGGGNTEKGLPAAESDNNSGNSDNINEDKPEGLGEFLEMPQFQAFLVTLLVLEVFAVTTTLLLGNYIASLGADDGSSMNAPAERLDFMFGFLSLQMMYEGLQSFLSFTLVFFAFEIGLVLIAFRSRTAGHWGYLLDAIVVGTQIYGELFGWGLNVHLLSLPRFWRLIRLQTHMVGRSDMAHEVTRKMLEAEQAKLRKAEADNKRLNLDIVREQEARISVDDMLTSYKEEVDTLNEALKIAAMDIAEVAEAEDDLLSDEEEMDEQLSRMGPAQTIVDDEGFSDAAGGPRDKAMNKASMLREARRDNQSFGGGSTASGATGRKSQSSVIFKVNTDGSYEQHG